MGVGAVSRTGVGVAVIELRDNVSNHVFAEKGHALVVQLLQAGDCVLYLTRTLQHVVFIDAIELGVESGVASVCHTRRFGFGLGRHVVGLEGRRSSFSHGSIFLVWLMRVLKVVWGWASLSLIFCETG
jgi:hypothetical protein